MMQALTMFQPEAILQTSDAGSIVAVEMARQETRIRMHHDESRTLSMDSYLSDEADRHYALRHIDSVDADRVYVFAPIPTTTRIFDIISGRYRWMGVHSAIRTLRFPVARPQYDEAAILPDSIERILRHVSMEEAWDDEEWYRSVKDRLPQYRDYVAWKWRLSPHAVYQLRRLQERTPQTATSSILSQSSTTFIPYTPPTRPRRKNFFQRLFGRSKHSEEPVAPSTSQQKPRPLSRFEQKMLQESRTRGN